MKKYISLLIIAILTAIVPACTQTPGANLESVSASQTVITFADAAFETKVKKALEKTDQNITAEEANAVTELDLSNESFDHRNANPDLDIKDITDIKYFSSLKRLNLSYNSLTDLSPLSQITSLKELWLTGVHANDFTPLKALININFITIQWIYAPDDDYYGLESLDMFADMKDLEVLDIKGCGVKDVSALGSLPKLFSVFLTKNLITDISPLANLKDLRELELGENPIADFSPLADIYDKLEYKDFDLN